MPYIIDSYKVVDKVKQNNSFINIYEATFKYQTNKLSEKEINDLIENIYSFTLNIKDIDELIDYMFQFLDKYDIDLETNKKIQISVLFKRKDL
jgi:hypothetical protein